MPDANFPAVLFNRRERAARGNQGPARSPLVNITGQGLCLFCGIGKWQDHRTLAICGHGLNHLAGKTTGLSGSTYQNGDSCMFDRIKQGGLSRFIQPAHFHWILGIFRLIGLDHSVRCHNSPAVQCEYPPSGLTFPQTLLNQCNFYLFGYADAACAGPMNKINLVFDILAFNFHGRKNGRQGNCTGTLDIIVE